MSTYPVRIAKQYRPYVDAALAAGWTLTVTGQGHPRLVPPAGWADPYYGGTCKGITFSQSPKNPTPQYLATDLRRVGIVPPKKGK